MDLRAIQLLRAKRVGASDVKPKASGTSMAQGWGTLRAFVLAKEKEQPGVHDQKPHMCLFACWPKSEDELTLEERLVRLDREAKEEERRRKLLHCLYRCLPFEVGMGSKDEGERCGVLRYDAMGRAAMRHAAREEARRQEAYPVSSDALL